MGYLISQFDYELLIEETTQFYEISFKEKREAQRAFSLFDVFNKNTKLSNTITRKLTNEEFVDFHEWCYNNIISGWLIYEYNDILDCSLEVPIFVESEEEMVLLKLKWC